jgi:hypothetical protein
VICRHVFPPVLALTASLLGAPPAAHAQNPSVTISVDAAANRHAIDPRIYGVAYGTTAALSDLNVVLNRYGGNNASRYNWKLNADNRGNDWYFESVPDASATPGGRGDDFIRLTKNAGAEAMITIPMVGYVGKLGPNRSKLASFSVSKYGAQTSNDAQWFPDAGDGIRASNGAPITGNNRLDANVAAGSTFQKGWIQHLVSAWGTAANGGLKYYLYDNEPSIWYATHRDVHPIGATMDEIKNRIIEYGNMIKTVDPSALLVGPEEWGWSGYFFSGYDLQYGQKHGWSSLPDRANHGGADYLPWLLDQLRQYEATHGKRLLDIFTVHYYPQGGEFSNDTSTSMQLLRNQSTRSLWDPNYVDRSWINTQVQLIPRIKGWVSTYYPGTLIGITEYNWGAEGHINGATTQADILGIFGREGLDLATRWTAPDPSTPTYKAIKLYCNYDGAKSTFGDSSCSASVPNPDTVSAFAAVRSLDGALTVMVISKRLSGKTPVRLNLSNFTHGSAAQVYQLTATNVITRLANLKVSSSVVSTTVPAQSITLLVIPGRASSGSRGGGGGTGGNPTFTTLASCSPSSLTHGRTVSITTTATDTGGALSNGIVDVEIYNTSSQKVYQQFASGQSFSQNEQRTYMYNWTPSTAGTYTVKIGVFSSNWGTLYHWNNGAATITVK